MLNRPARIRFKGIRNKICCYFSGLSESGVSAYLEGMTDLNALMQQAQAMQQKLQEASFDFSDFVQQMRLIKRMGSLGGLMKLIPGMNKIDDGMLKQGEEQLKKIGGMEFYDVHFSYIDLEDMQEKFVSVLEQGGGGRRVSVHLVEWAHKHKLAIADI